MDNGNVPPEKSGMSVDPETGNIHIERGRSKRIHHVDGSMTSIDKNGKIKFFPSLPEEPERVREFLHRF